VHIVEDLLPDVASEVAIFGVGVERVEQVAEPVF
jgi:hypothetical protein